MTSEVIKKIILNIVVSQLPVFCISTRLVELKDLLIIRFHTIFVPKIFKRTRVWTD